MADEIPNVIRTDDSGSGKETDWWAILNYLRDVRIARKISVRKLSMKMNAHPTHLARMEKGETIPSILLVLRWCEALDLDLFSLGHNLSRQGRADKEIG